MRTAILLFCLMGASSRVAAAPMADPVVGPWVLTNATLHVGDGRVLTGATIVMEDGRIVAVTTGPAVVTPAGASVLDCTGKHVTPGFIAADTTIGLSEIGAVRATRDDTEVGDINPDVAAAAAFNPDSELLGVAMANGVLAAVVAPRGGLVPGQASVMLLTGWTHEDMAVKSPAALVVQWPNLAIDRSTGTKTPVEDQERALRERLELLDDLVARARVDRAARRSGQRAAERAEDPGLRALEPVLDRILPVFVQANTVAQIRQAIAWGKRQDLRIVLGGARDAWRIAGEIASAGVPVVIGDVRTMPAHDHDPYDAPFAQPGLLVKAGVKIAFTILDPAHVRNLPDEAAMGIPYGLSPENALRAITQWPAEIFGVDDSLGTVAEGKLGNVVTWSGPPLEITSRVEAIFVRGESIPIQDRHSRLYEKYRARPRPTAAAPPQR